MTDKKGEEDKNVLGKRGESLFATSVTRFIEGLGRIFDPTFLGDKFPDADFYVQLLHYHNKKAFFLATVKTTTRGFYDAEQTKLNIIISKEKMGELIKFQVPVYLFAINDKTEKVYIINVNQIDIKANFNGMPVNYELMKKIWKRFGGKSPVFMIIPKKLRILLQNLNILNMENNKSFEEYRAERLGYVYLSRLNNLIIKESDVDHSFFDYLVDIGQDQKGTGRFFGVEVKDFSDYDNTIKEILNEYSNISIPSLLVYFDNTTDKGFYKWIKKPQPGGVLAFEEPTKDPAVFNDESLKAIVGEVTSYYQDRLVA